jgi:hypothetical protein
MIKELRWLQSAGEVQKLLSACNDNIRTLVAVLVGVAKKLRLHDLRLQAQQ